MLESKVTNIDDGIELVIIDIINLDVEDKLFLDNHIVEICEGSSDTELKDMKNRLLSFLERKTIITQYGAVAEFFIHAHLKHSGFKQEFLFFNLEEGSIKKGFDGVFTKDQIEYILESKSGESDSIGISHESKLKEAYNDLKNYVSGKSKKGSNNPWRNAYNHASHADVGSSKSLREKIKKLSDLYDSKDFKKISEFNIIPCSTIFVIKDSLDNFSRKINEDNKFLMDFEGNSIRAICVTKHTFESFKSYLRN